MKWMIVVVLMYPDGQTKQWNGPVVYEVREQCETALKARSVGAEEFIARSSHLSKSDPSKLVRMTCEGFHDKVMEVAR